MSSSITAKNELRARLVQARRELSSEDHDAFTAAVRKHLESELTESMTVAAYWPLGSEPGGADFVPWLKAHVSRVLLPISGENGTLTFAEYRGKEAMHTSPLGLNEPQGPSFDSSVLAECDLVLAPAMAVDAKGNRMGKGGGYYDRALEPLPHGKPPVFAMVYPTEFLDELPTEDHDRKVDAAVTAEGITRF
ncbi:5-formyltetrahydrofolate cyclo-ligase [Corynebacterium tuberculostearicum]|uniref:5-formyltetrahydrofolate cyclo-ligase n=1 Tax=Corynebacterium tuberculostearicum TaxID=38304 RepID=UPI0026512977|nr:5-formyltetrahydrofolate cyclo-ligase [Corynebacterium tuberculostearicum]MDN8596747.1 5-formyltetrahydrofolate cyclo-ligase [Corynebacterium tuberculostearicum]